MIDLRGDQGGASRIVTKLLTTLWGVQMVQAHSLPIGDISYRTTAQSRAVFSKALESAKAAADAVRDLRAMLG